MQDEYFTTATNYKQHDNDSCDTYYRESCDTYYSGRINDIVVKRVDTFAQEAKQIIA